MSGLNSKLAIIQQKLKAPKGQFNKFANFNYRSCEDILEALKPLLGDLTLRINDEVVNIGDRYYIRATVSLWDSTERIETTAFAREAQIKTGMDEAQITGAASSYARKYALNGLFLIDDTKDADTQDNTIKPIKKLVPKMINTKEDAEKATNKVAQEVMEEEPESVESVVCETCGKAVSERVKTYSLKQYNKVLCMADQLKEGK